MKLFNFKSGAAIISPEKRGFQAHSARASAPAAARAVCCFQQQTALEHFLFENALLTRKRQPPQRGVHSGEKRGFRLNATFDFHKKSKVICSKFRCLQSLSMQSLSRFATRDKSFTAAVQNLTFVLARSLQRTAYIDFFRAGLWPVVDCGIAREPAQNFNVELFRDAGRTLRMQPAPKMLISAAENRDIQG
ncbi:hypothetical protein [Desulfovibrio sp. ZJ369]|uniref:hypothetical protein n=1 Tax=Desulfovibrio sp. ZJ369 TaxID=2709793 RepID=UPI0013ED8E53|nr:hypothetical protein [Desulfovibrio sp. ZJ369]